MFYSPVDASRIAAWNARCPHMTEDARELLQIALSEGFPAAEYAGCLSLCLSEEGRYAFTYPTPLDDTGDADAFLDRLDAYVLAEEVPLVLTETPRECLPALRSRYRHIESAPLDDENVYVLVRAVTEAEELDDCPTLYGARVVLAPLADEDALPYATLCRDDETLRYYGYDVRREIGDGREDTCFLDAARGEWERRRTLPLAVRFRDRFVGEILLYGFDARGGASVAVRLLPGERGRGFASDALGTLLSYAKDTLGLLRVRAQVREENLPSLRLFDRFMNRTEHRSGSVFYEI